MNALDKLVDRYLVRGDEAAMDEVVRRTRPRLLRAARRIVGADEADDCVQTAYLSLIHKRGARLAAPVLPWLLTAVVRTAYRRRAKARRWTEIAERLRWAKEAETPVMAAVRGEEALALRSRIDQLPAGLRDVVVLHSLEGLGTRETARLLDLKEPAVRKRMQRARALLRAPLGPRVASAFLALPWWLSDRAAGATTLGGVAVKKNVAIAAVLLIAAGTVWWLGGTGSERQDRSSTEVADAPEGTDRETGMEDGNDEKPTESEEQGPSFEGVVLDVEGAPVPGARVHLASGQAERAPHPLGADRRGSTSAGPGGRFRLRCPDDLREAECVLLADAPGHGPAVLRRVRAGTGIRLVLSKETAFHGRVLDIEGRPVPKAKVRWRALIHGVQVERETLAGPKGRFRLPGAMRIDHGYAPSVSHVLVTAPGFAPLLLEQQPTAEPTDFYLVRGATVRGTVRHAGKDAPVAGARVVLWSLEGSGVRANHRGERVAVPWAPRILGETRSDATGKFEFRHVPAEGFHRVRSGMSGRQGPLVGYVRAHAEGLVCNGDEVPARADGETIQFELRCWPTSSVSGRVVDDAGRPQKGMQVLAYAPDRKVVFWPRNLDPALVRPEVRTDDAGRFRIEEIPAPVSGSGKVKVRVTRADLGAQGPSLEAEGSVTGKRTTTLPDIVWTSRRPAAVEVHVRSTAGDPIPDATVLVTGFGYAHTDREGVGRVENWHLTGSRPTAVRVQANGFASKLQRGIQMVAGETSTVEVVLDPGHTVSGRLVWRDGTPAAGGSVTILDGSFPATFPARPPAGRRAGRGADPRQPKTLASVFVSKDGRFEATGLPPGPYHIRALHKDFPGHKTLESVSARGPLRIELPKEPPSNRYGRISGSVVDAESGKPLLRFQAHADPEPGLSRRRELGTVTGPGRFRIDGLPAGKWTVTVRAPGYEPSRLEDLEVSVRETTEAVEIRLGRGRRVRGKVKNGSSHSLRDARLSLVGEGGYRPTPSLLRKDGTYEITGVRPGTYRVSVWLPRGTGPVAPDRPITVTVAESATLVTLDFRVVDGGTARISAVAPHRGLNAVLTVLDEEGKTIFRATSYQVGALNTLLLAPGRYTAELRDGEKNVQKPFEVKGGKTVQVGLTLK